MDLDSLQKKIHSISQFFNLMLDKSQDKKKPMMKREKKVNE
jgi:hypothetical protein